MEAGKREGGRKRESEERKSTSILTAFFTSGAMAHACFPPRERERKKEGEREGEKRRKRARENV
jgi:hypothetical protein